MTPAEPHPQYQCKSLNDVYNYATCIDDNLSINKKEFLKEVAYLFYLVDEDLKITSHSSAAKSADAVLEETNKELRQQIKLLKMELRQGVRHAVGGILHHGEELRQQGKEE